MSICRRKTSSKRNLADLQEILKQAEKESYERDLGSYGLIITFAPGALYFTFFHLLFHDSVPEEELEPNTR